MPDSPLPDPVVPAAVAPEGVAPGRWLDWTKRLAALAQNGLTFCQNPFDRERYEAIRQVAAEMLAAGGRLDPAVTLDFLGHETGYATPKVDVRGAVFREPDGRLLLVREKLDGGWSLPGGWADVGESPTEAVTKEIWEEAGFRTRPLKLIGVYDRAKHPHHPATPLHVYKLFVLCEIVGGHALTDTTETSGAEFFAEDELPAEDALSVARVTRGQLARCFAHRRDPGLPADLD